MYELLLIVVASAACVALGLARVSPKSARPSFGRPDLGRVARAGALAGALFLAAALGAGPSPFAVSGMLVGAWTAGACLFGAIVSELGSVVAGEADPSADARAAAARTIVLQACVLLGLGGALFAACAATGALKHPELLAPGAPRLVVGFAAGAAMSDAVAAEVAIEAVLAMVPLAALFERNAVLLRGGPLATSAIGLFALPLAIRALGLLALGASSRAMPKDDADATSTGRAAWVFVSLAALSTFGATFALAGVFWPSALFCAVAGVGAALVAWRASAGRSTAWLPLAAIGGAVVASVAVAARTGLAHGVALALPMVVVGARLLVLSLETLEHHPAPVGTTDDERGSTDTRFASPHVLGAALLAPLGLLATADAATAGACSRWAARDLLPDTDPAALLARCESARVAVDHVDLLRPGTLVGAAVGAVLVLDAPEHESSIGRGARGLVAIVTCVAMRLAFDSGGATAAALVGALLLTAAIARGEGRKRVAFAVSAAVVALTPIFA